MIGYADYQYAHALSLAEHGLPHEMQRSGGWVLRRPIPGSAEFDAMGCYPFFACRDWSGLGADIESLRPDTVNVFMVTDPFGGYSYGDLQSIFPDVCFPFKEHFIVDLEMDPRIYIDPHHRRNIKQSLHRVKVEVSDEPSDWLDEWRALYDVLIDRHQIKGMTRFSEDSFRMQLSVPGITAFKALYEGQTVGMLLWYKQGDVAYYHLGAYNDLGYQQKASFALFGTLIEYFADQKTKWLSLGAGAGSQNDGQDGLTRFKRGWSTGTRTAYFCGRILDHQKYQQIIASKNLPPTKFFPAYRLGEF
jgi:hypothetical protein